MTDLRAARKFGKIVRELRKRRRWSQEELAAELNVAAGWISLIETGKKNPTLETITRLAEVLDVRITFADKRL